jgi:pSer/pThr/pTyr-binding forkhead associated (FHA) protein
MSIDYDYRVGAQLCSQLCSLQQDQAMPSSSSSSRASPTYEAPGWAVPASGEARLEPVFDSVNRQPPIDLTERAVFRIGRSPSSNVQLLHATSSRNHAMLFHHKNGSCYIIDCNSAHGTFVNGTRITSLPSDGVVVPHRVKRGSIVRFGGPGAPSFMLKSFSFGLEEMKEYPSNMDSTLSPRSAVNAEVEHNTRFNSLGNTARTSLMMDLCCKRSFDSMSTVEDVDFDDCKRSRCSSPPLSPLQLPMRLVSPDLQPGQKRRRVSFSNAPPKSFYPNLVSPDLSSDENDREETI